MHTIRQRIARTVAGFSLGTALALRLPLRFLRGHGGRTVLAVIALAAGVAQVGAYDLVGREALRSFVEVIDTMAGRVSLQVGLPGEGMFPAEVAAAIEAIPGVVRVVPVLAATAFTDDETGDLISIQAIDVSSPEAIDVYEIRAELGLDDPKLLLPDTIILTTALAERRGIALGDTITLDTPVGKQRFVARGLLDPRGVARIYGGNFALLDLENAQHLFAKPGVVNRVDIVVARDRKIADVATAVAAALPQGYRVEPPSQRQADLHEVMHAFQMLLWALGLAGLGGAFLIAYNGLASLFEVRAQQLAILRAIGVRQGAVWWELIREGALLGAGGVALGIPTAIAIAVILLPMIRTAAALSSGLVEPGGALALRATSLLLSVILGLGAGLLAAGLAGWRAAQQGVAGSLQRRGREPSEWGQGRVVRRFFVVAMTVAMALHVSTESAAWGLLTTIFVVLATGLSARPLLARVAVLAYIPSTRALPTLRLAFKSLAEHPRRSSLTVAMIGTSLACVLWLWMVAHSFQEAVITSVSQSMHADLLVSSAHVASGFREAPVSDRIIDSLRQIAGVATIVGERTADWTHAGVAVGIAAYDPEYFSSGIFGQWPLVRGEQDVWNRVARGEAVVVSSSFVRNFGTGLGEMLTIDAPLGKLQLPVAGVMVHLASPQGIIGMNRDLYARHWGDSTLTRALVRLDSAAQVDTVQQAIARGAGREFRLRVLAGAEIVDYFANQVERAFLGIYVLAAIALVVSILGISDTLGAEVIERTREIGILRAIGLRRHHLHRAIVVEGAVLTAAGLAIAAVGGLFLGALWVKITFPALLGWVFEPQIPYRMGSAMMATTLLLCVLAVLLPAQRAARMDPAAALRRD